MFHSVYLRDRLQARMATKRAKPNGQYFLEESYVEEYFRDIAISDLPGVGYSTTTKLNQLQWSTCSDLQHMPLVKIQQELGKKLGETLYNYCRGIDNKPLAYDQVLEFIYLWRHFRQYSSCGINAILPLVFRSANLYRPK